MKNNLLSDKLAYNGDTKHGLICICAAILWIGSKRLREMISGR